MTKTNEFRYQPTGKYRMVRDRNGTEDEIAIISPTGRQMAVIWFWDEPDTTDAATAEKDAQAIVDAMNDYNHMELDHMTTEKLKRCVESRRQWSNYHEAAERGYDFAAAREARRVVYEAERELERRLVAEEQQGEGNAAEQAEVLERAAE